MVAMWFTGYTAVDTATHRILTTSAYQRYHGTEMCRTISLPVHIVEQQAHISLVIMAGARSISRRMYTRSTSKGIHLETCIVGKAVATVYGSYMTGLYQGVLLQCITCLGYILMTAYFTKGQYSATVSKYRPHLMQLVRVVGGED